MLKNKKNENFNLDEEAYKKLMSEISNITCISNLDNEVTFDTTEDSNYEWDEYDETTLDDYEYTDSERFDDSWFGDTEEE